jgi:uncharacterized metal-binding protein YceD (DUF177 family)
MTRPWNAPVRLGEVGAGPLAVQLEPDAVERAKLARELGLGSMPALTASLTLTPWMDGVEIIGRFDAVVEQVCAVSVEPFTHPLSGEIELRAVPAGSPHAPTPSSGEADYDPEAPDPPEVFDNDRIDVAAYVVEQLALEIDPFARKPGAVFEFTPDREPESPFAVLQKLRGGEP